MNTEQNYGANPAPATPVEPTDGSTTPAANSGQPTATQPPPIAFPTLHLIYTREGIEQNTAQIAFRALATYRSERLKWLVSYLQQDLPHDALGVLHEMRGIDELQEMIVIGFEQWGTSLFNRVLFHESSRQRQEERPSREEVEKELNQLLAL